MTVIRTLLVLGGCPICFFFVCLFLLYCSKACSLIRHETRTPSQNSSTIFQSNPPPILLFSWTPLTDYEEIQKEWRILLESIKLQFPLKASLLICNRVNNGNISSADGKIKQNSPESYRRNDQSLIAWHFQFRTSGGGGCLLRFGPVFFLWIASGLFKPSKCPTVELCCRFCIGSAQRGTKTIWLGFDPLSDGGTLLFEACSTLMVKTRTEITWKTKPSNVFSGVMWISLLNHKKKGTTTEKRVVFTIQRWAFAKRIK